MECFFCQQKFTMKTIRHTKIYYKHKFYLFNIYSIYPPWKNINSLWNICMNIYRLYISGTKVEKAMSDIAKVLGQRIRNHRTSKGFSQEKLAELSGCHPTYIGQIERGEKNATIESIEKISAALDVSLSTLFEKLGTKKEQARNIPLKCYEFLSSKTKEEQEHIYRILLEMDQYKKN